MTDAVAVVPEETEDQVVVVLGEIELARRRAVEAVIDNATSYMGVVEEVSVDGLTVRVRRADEAAGTGRWLTRLPAPRPPVDASVPVLVLTGRNARGQIETIGIALPPVGGDAFGDLIIAGNLSIIAPTGPSGITIGNPAGTGVSAYLDFQADGNNSPYDARIVVTGGSATEGRGTLNIRALELKHEGSEIWTDENTGARINASHIAANSVGASELAANAVNASNITGNSIGQSELGPNCVGSSELQSGVVAPGHLDRAYSPTTHAHNEYLTAAEGNAAYAPDPHPHPDLLSKGGGSMSGNLNMGGNTLTCGQATISGTIDHNGTKAGFMGATAKTRRTIGAAAGGDVASCAAAINRIRTALIELGLCQA